MFASSFDVGSINCGICLFDGTAQRILFFGQEPSFWMSTPYVIHDAATVKKHVDQVTETVDTLLQNRPCWVLVEQQYVGDEAKHGTVFNLQLESCISMSFVQNRVEVRTVQATKRYPFVGITSWQQDNRYRRKQNVVNVIVKS